MLVSIFVRVDVREKKRIKEATQGFGAPITGHRVARKIHHGMLVSGTLTMEFEAIVLPFDPTAQVTRIYVNCPLNDPPARAI